MRVHNEPVPKEKLQQFHDILCSTGGRYLNNPREVGGVYCVDYEPGDYARQCKAWKQVIIPIKECRVSRRRRFSNRIKNLIKSRIISTK